MLVRSLVAGWLACWLAFWTWILGCCSKYTCSYGIASQPEETKVVMNAVDSQRLLYLCRGRECYRSSRLWKKIYLSETSIFLIFLKLTSHYPPQPPPALTSSFLPPSLPPPPPPLYQKEGRLKGKRVKYECI